MPKFDPGTPRALVTFQCRPCKKTFEAEPARTEDAPELEHHPFRYFADCPGCGAEVAQAPWERALMKAWQNATGPRSDEGKAAAARNLEGHPTPEEARRTRFNAMKHGLHARSATYFPAKPDGYSFCSGCDVDRTWCGEQPACVKKTELFMLHQAAFEQRDPKRLMGVYSELHSALFAVLQQILQTIIADGVKITAPQYYTDKEGLMVIAQYVDDHGKLTTINDISAHPLFKPLGELLSRLNLTLSDMGMTTKVIENEEGQQGHLTPATQDDMSDFKRAQMKALEALAGKLERGQGKTSQDPVLLEYNMDSGEATPVNE
jgi:hypothetical protein